MHLSKIVCHASLVKAFSAFAVLIVYSVWAFTTDTSWTDAMNAAGRLPETAPGFHQDLPGAAFGKLGGAKNSYQKFQLIDIPYALLNTIFALTSIGLGLKTLNLALSAGRFLLFVPLIYLGAEAIENTLLLAMSATLIDISHRAVFIQQAATTIKFIAIGPALTLSILAISIAAVRALRR